MPDGTAPFDLEVRALRLYDAEIMPLYDPLPVQNGPLPHLKLMGFDYLWPYYTGKGTVVPS